MKQCSKCKEWKSLDKFSNCKTVKDGKQCKCKECMKRYYIDNKEEIDKHHKQYYIDNKDEINEHNKQNYIDNKDEITKQHKQYYEVHKDEITEYYKQYYKDHKDKIIEYNKQWYEDNKGEILKHQKQYYLDNSEEIAKYQKQYRQTPEGKLADKNSKHKRRLIKLGTDSKDKTTIEEWNNIILSQNNCCLMCNKEFSEDLKPTMDHIIPLNRWNEFPDVIIHSKDNIQALCQSCNSRKGVKLINELNIH